jgi:hypothetical protein
MQNINYQKQEAVNFQKLQSGAQRLGTLVKHAVEVDAKEKVNGKRTVL